MSVKSHSPKPITYIFPTSHLYSNTDPTKPKTSRPRQLCTPHRLRFPARPATTPSYTFSDTEGAHEPPITPLDKKVNKHSMLKSKPLHNAPGAQEGRTKTGTENRIQGQSSVEFPCGPRAENIHSFKEPHSRIWRSSRPSLGHRSRLAQGKLLEETRRSHIKVHGSDVCYL